MMNILVIGGSRNIGYFSAIRFLDAGHTVTFLLRSSSAFNNDQIIQNHADAGRAFLVTGDALILDDVKRVWTEAISHSSSNTVDLCLFTVGGIPNFSVSKGFTISPPNLVTHSLINVLCTLPSTNTRLITLSSTGLTRTSHASLPLLLKPLYGWLLERPHQDKVGAERIVAHSAGWKWNTKADGEPGPEILSADWEKTEGLPTPGSLQKVLVIRPALLTDGPCRAETLGERKGKDGKEIPRYRVSEQELGGWAISRKDVAHFVADAALKRWDEFEGKIVNIAY